MYKKFTVAVAVFLFCAQAFAQMAKAKLDHVMIDVRDLRAAKDRYAHLGFALSSGGRHPTGTENSSARFVDGGYLELVAPYDPTLSLGRRVAEFLKQGDGAEEAGLEIASAEQTARDLTSAGLKVKGPTPGTIMFAGATKPPPPLWWTIAFADKIASRPLFLIQNVGALNRSSITAGWIRGSGHPNSASNFTALLIAVNDPEKAALGYGNIGKLADREVPLPEFGAAAREIVLERSSIFLLSATDPLGPTARRLKDRGEGILALRLAVEDLDQARKQIGDRNVSKNQQSILIPPENAAGVWLQFLAVVPSGMHKEISLPKKTLTSYTGTYQMAPHLHMTITLVGDQLLSQLTGGERKIPMFAEADGKFFTKRMPAQLQFVRDGDVKELILHQNGMERPMKRLDDSEAKRIADESAAQAAMAAQRFKDQRQAPGSETALRRILEEWRLGQPKYELMGPDLADFTRQNVTALRDYFSWNGAVESVTFKRVDQNSADIYEVRFAHDLREWGITLESDGKIASCRTAGY